MERKGNKSMERPKLWTKNFLMIWGINFFTHTVFYSLLATVTLHVTTNFGMNQGAAGLAVGIYVLMALIARLFAGKIVEVIGSKKILIISSICFFLAIIAHLFASTFFLLIIIRAIHGFTFGFLMTSAGAIMADVVPDERRGEGTGYYATAMNIAMAIGPFIGLIVMRMATFEMLIWILVVIGFCNLISIFLTISFPTKSRDSKVSLTISLSDVFEKKAIPIGLCIFALALGYSSLLSFLSLYTTDIGHPSVGTYFFVVYAIALVLTRPITGRLFDRFGENWLTYPMLAILVVGFLVLSLANSSWMILLASVLIGIGYGTVQSNYLAIAIKEADSHRKATATSTFFIFMDLAIAVGPYIYGLLLGQMSYRSVYSWTVIWLLLSIVVYFVFHGRKVSNRSRQQLPLEN